jgi:enoyl-CoA hydratase/carnithine racemase
MDHQSATDDLHIECRGPVLWLTISREARRNAVTNAVIADLQQAITLAHSNPAIRVIVLTGAGDKAFCAGADLQSGTAFQFDHSQPYHGLADLLRAAHNSTIPLIARVNGACMAGGMGLLAMCDLVVCSDHAVFGLPEVKVGLFPAQVLAALQDLLPRRLLNEMCLTGEPIDAARACDVGLVNHVAPAGQLDEKLDWLLARLLDKSPAAQRRGLYMLKHIDSMPFPQALAFAESQIGLFALTDDAKEGQSAFREKRQPVWVGR